jgi:error-prone DNA polymerase
VNTLLQDARRHGVRVRPVCVVESGVRTEVLADGSLRLGLQRLKGLSAGTMGRLVAARGVAAFGSVGDLAERVGPTLKEQRVLAAAGPHDFH